jgi:hypothetical protein
MKTTHDMIRHAESSSWRNLVKSSQSKSHQLNIMVFIPLGPGALELDRLDDLLDSIITHQGTALHILIVNDSAEKRPLDGFLKKYPFKRFEIISPATSKVFRRFTSQLSAHTLLAIEHFVKFSDCKLLLKLDTDALIIGPFADQIIDL